MLAPPPPPLESLPYGYRLTAGGRPSTVLADMDFETYSEGGWVWNDDAQKWEKPAGTAKGKSGGLPVIGAAAYAEHPSTEILSLKYDLKDGHGRRHWIPGRPLPQDLFDHLAAGKLVACWNAGFEQWIWNKVAVFKYGFPTLNPEQLRCDMAKARANAWPGKLDKATEVMRLKNRKDADGDRLLKKFSIPRNPTKTDRRRRITPAEDPADAQRLYDYNEQDIIAEAEASSVTPDLSPDNLESWLADQDINRRGVQMDTVAISNCIAVVEQALALYNTELYALTGGAVPAASMLERLKAWAATRGVVIYQLREEDLDELLKRKDLPPEVYRALEIRALTGSASVKKLFTMRNQITRTGRIHDLFNWHAARTGRATGADAQAHNLPKSGPNLFGPTKENPQGCCGRYFGAHRYDCPWCGVIWPPGKPQEWTWKAVDDALKVIAGRSLHAVEYYFGDAMLTVSGVLRGLFVAAAGHDMIASDYTAIEGVVTAALAGEEWRLGVFASGEDIYLASASKITGISVEVYKEHRRRTGAHHPHRQPYGKVAELSSGFGGWIGAWIQFGAGEFFTEDEIKKHILTWRDASLWIVELWGGQARIDKSGEFSGRWTFKPEYFGLEGMAIQAVLNPGQRFTYRAPHPLAQPITYVVENDVLYCWLPSGRAITYHRPYLSAGSKGLYQHGLTLSYEGWNTNPNNGPTYAWIRMETYGGKLTENVVQAVAYDILAYAIINLRRAGYPIVLHVHDEIVAEIIKTWGSIEEFERIMGQLPEWATGWPLKAAGGWRGYRYRKD